MVFVTLPFGVAVYFRSSASARDPLLEDARQRGAGGAASSSSQARASRRPGATVISVQHAEFLIAVLVREQSGWRDADGGATERDAPPHAHRHRTNEVARRAGARAAISPSSRCASPTGCGLRSRSIQRSATRPCRLRAAASRRECRSARNREAIGRGPRPRHRAAGRRRARDQG